MSYFNGQRQTLMFSATMPMKVKGLPWPQCLKGATKWVLCRCR